MILTTTSALGILRANQSRCRNRVAEHETNLTLSADTLLGRIQQWVRVSANLFYPERRSFVRAPWSGSQSIPVKVASHKLVNGREPAGVGICKRTHPPCRTEERQTSMRRWRTVEAYGPLRSLFSMKRGHELKRVAGVKTREGAE